MNVTELARKLKIPTARLREIMPRIGFDVGRKAIKVDDKVAQKIIEKIKQNPNLLKKVVEKKEDEEPENEKIKSNTIEIPQTIVVRDFATLMSKTITEVIQELMKNGILANLNEQIDYETAAIIASDFGFKTKLKEINKLNIPSQKIEDLIKEDKKNLTSRPPVVVVMGHVDHGKTMLLDSIRKTNIIAQEAGGITQHIGAYQVQKKGKLITFIDTPGHEAFTSMRSRGAKIADISILVVAADDGIKPQTREALKIIQSAKLPFVVAINKIDKKDANIDKVKQQLTELNLAPEEWGGKTICVSVSAKTNKGIDDLLETLLLVAEMEKENIMANPNSEAVGTVIEARIDKGEGPVATVIIKNGTLKRGDLVKVGNVLGKIKAMKDYLGKLIDKAPPSIPVKILGLKNAPEVGDILQVEKDAKLLKKMMKEQHHHTKLIREKTLATKKGNEKEEEDEEKEKKVDKLNIILKTDNLGSQEAILSSLEKLSMGDIKVGIARKGLGNISEADISHAEGGKTIIYGFNVAMTPDIQRIVHEKSVEVRIYKIIYELIDDVTKELEKLLVPEIVRIELGRLKVLAIFRKEKKIMILGGQITKGKAENNSLANIIRNKEKIGSGKITQLQMAKTNVEIAPSGTECGIKFEGSNVIEIGDFLEVYKEEKVYKKLI